MEWKKVRKLPVVVEAIQFNGDVDAMRTFLETKGAILSHGDEILIPTLEGTMRANKGDWIIRGLKGEMYPCKPDIFEKSYEVLQAD